MHCVRVAIQWNLDLTKSLGTVQICSLNGAFVISRFFSIHFTVTLAGTLYREIISFVISRTSLNRGSLNRGSTVLIIRFLLKKPRNVVCFEN